MQSDRFYRRATVCCLNAFFIVFFSGSPTHAELIRYEFAGTVTTAGDGTAFRPGDRFTGTFAFDPANALGGVTTESFENYFFGRSVNIPGSTKDGSGLGLIVGSQTILSDTGGVQIAVEGRPNTVQAGYSISISNNGIDGSAIQASLQLDNPSKYATSLAIPSVLSLSDFSSAVVNVTEHTQQGTKTLFGGTIDELAPTSVPEPTACAAFAFAVIVGLYHRHAKLRIGHALSPRKHSVSEQLR